MGIVGVFQKWAAGLKSVSKINYLWSVNFQEDFDFLVHICFYKKKQICTKK